MTALMSALRGSFTAFLAWRLWTSARRRLWRSYGVRYPAVLGWETLVKEVSSVPLWQKDGLFGLPLEWTLLVRQPDGRLADFETTCAWSGSSISGLTPINTDTDPPQHDLSRWGVRCSRCHTPIHHRFAGMRFGNDVPSCVPCRRAVRRVMQGI